MLLFQGRPTDASYESETLQYGGGAAKDYVPGAEVLMDSEEMAADGTCVTSHMR